MPYRFEREKKRIPPEKDRRAKLTPEQRAEIARNAPGKCVGGCDDEEDGNDDVDVHA